jgi:MoaA/NifB/PqqE/SkfB family radical SAM enzyme
MIPIDAVLAVTYNCNSKCRICQIWRNKSTNEVDAQVYRKLPPTLKYINISGGEPFLRDDLPEIISVIKKQCPSSNIIISTNGFLTQKIENIMKEVYRIDPTIGMGFSVDGVEEMHNWIRGIPDGYERLMKSLELVKKIGIKNVRLAFTCSPENVAHFRKVYHIANHLEAQFTCAIVHDSSHYFKLGKTVSQNISALKEELEDIIRFDLKSFNLKRWIRAYFEKGLYYFAAHRKRLLPCQAGERSFFLNPYGDIYPCVIKDKIMGNLAEDDFQNIWESRHSHLIREEVHNCTKGCWMVCTARTSILSNKRKVIAWVIKNKLKSHKGKVILT